MSKSSLYLIIKCNDCEFFFGKHKKSNFSCTRCGEIQINPQIIGRTNDTEELHRLVSLNNIPQELSSMKDELSQFLLNNDDNLIINSCATVCLDSSVINEPLNEI